jgi:hypothetical protein
MNYGYGWEKLFLALNGAVSSEKSPKQRLADAYLYQIKYVTQQNVPAEVWRKITDLEAALRGQAAVGDEGSVAASVSALSDDEARKWLLEIVSMFNEVAQAHGVDKNKER